ncbi:MAG: TRAP transporter small permease [Methyloligellaceae bacterium]
MSDSDFNRDAPLAAGSNNSGDSNKSNSGPTNPSDRALSEDYLIPALIAGHLTKPIQILTFMTSAFIGLIAAVTFVDVTGRYLFNSPIHGGVEIIEFLLGLTIFSALPLVTVKRAHIVVELFDGMMSAGFKKIRDVVVLLGSAVMIVFITERMWSTALDMQENGDISIHLEVSTAPLVYFLCFLSAVSVLVQLYMIWKHVFEPFRRDSSASG